MAFPNKYFFNDEAFELDISKYPGMGCTCTAFGRTAPIWSDYVFHGH